MKVMTLEVNTKKIFEKPVKKPRNIPISITTFFLVLQYTVGHDLGFSGVINRKIRFLCSYFSRVLSLVSIIIFFTPLITYDTSPRLIWGLLGFATVIGHVITLHSVKYNAYHFVMDIRSIDSNTMRCKEKFAGIFASGVYIFIFMSRLTASYMICFNKKEQCQFDVFPFSVAYCILLGCQESLWIVQVLIYYYVYCAVKYLKYLVDSRKYDLDDIRKQFTYIADCCDKIQPLYGYLVSIIPNAIDKSD